MGFGGAAGRLVVRPFSQCVLAGASPKLRTDGPVLDRAVSGWQGLLPFQKRGIRSQAAAGEAGVRQA